MKPVFKHSLRRIKHVNEYILFSCLMFIFARLGLDRASAFGGWMARKIGPRLSLHQRARTHLTASFPDKTPDDIDAILNDMWDNLGRVFAEYPFIAQIATSRTSVENSQFMDEYIAKDDPTPCIFISAHLANWEISGPTLQQSHHITATPVYRAPNNPYIDRAIVALRAKGTASVIDYIPKSSQGARQIVKSLKNKQHIAILIDQKYNQGIALPFFGRPAMTSDAFADLALKFGAYIVPARITRTKGANFKLVFSPVISLQNADGSYKLSRDITAQCQDLCEKWVRDTPAQWLWIHRRWGADGDNKQDAK